MASQWYTTLEESRAQFGGYQVNPEKPTERVLSRVFHGISKVAFPGIRASLDSTSELTNPLVDNQAYEGTWRIKDIRTQDGQGELAGSLTVIQDIANELNDGTGSDNEYLAGLQSDALELTEYAWMKYIHYMRRTTKKWTNLTQVAAEAAGGTLGKLHLSRFSVTLPDSWIGSVGNIDNEGGYGLRVQVSSSYKDFREGVAASTAEITGTWGYPYWNAVWFDSTSQQGADPIWCILDTFIKATDNRYYVTSHDPATNTATFVMFLYASRITNPKIDSFRSQEENDRSFTVYRTLSDITYPAIMREIYLQYAGMTKTSELPVDGSNTIKLTGFLNQTEEIYQNARFRIGSDVYTVTADATCVAGAVTLAVTPEVTLATSNAHLADPANEGARAFFNAIG